MQGNNRPSRCIRRIGGSAMGEPPFGVGEHTDRHLCYAFEGGPHFIPNPPQSWPLLPCAERIVSGHASTEGRAALSMTDTM
jgi:hypothetical protein